MLFFVTLEDHPALFDLRTATRPAHLAYMAQHEKNIILGGPTSNDFNADKNGTVLLVDFPDHQSVTDFLDDDPYNKEGLFANRTVVVWHPARVSTEALSNLIQRSKCID